MRFIWVLILLTHLKGYQLQEQHQTISVRGDNSQDFLQPYPVFNRNQQSEGEYAGSQTDSFGQIPYTRYENPVGHVLPPSEYKNIRVPQETYQSQNFLRQPYAPQINLPQNIGGYQLVHNGELSESDNNQRIKSQQHNLPFQNLQGNSQFIHNSDQNVNHYTAQNNDDRPPISEFLSPTVQNQAPFQITQQIPKFFNQNVQLYQQNIPQNIQQNFPQQITQNFPHNIPLNFPQDIPKNYPQDFAQNIQQNNPQDIYQNIAQENHRNFLQNFQQQIPLNVPHVNTQNYQQNIPPIFSQEIPQSLPQNVEQNIPLNVPYDNFKNYPQNNPSIFPHVIPQNSPQSTPQNIPLSFPHGTSLSLPQNIPQKFQQYFSQEIPQNFRQDTLSSYRYNLPESFSPEVSHTNLQNNQQNSQLNIPHDISQNIEQHSLANNFPQNSFPNKISHNQPLTLTQQFNLRTYVPQHNHHESTYHLSSNFGQDQDKQFQSKPKSTHQGESENLIPTELTPNYYGYPEFNNQIQGQLTNGQLYTENQRNVYRYPLKLQSGQINEDGYQIVNEGPVNHFVTVGDPSTDVLGDQFSSNPSESSTNSIQNYQNTKREILNNHKNIQMSKNGKELLRQKVFPNLKKEDGEEQSEVLQKALSSKELDNDDDLQLKTSSDEFVHKDVTPQEKPSNNQDR